MATIGKTDASPVLMVATTYPETGEDWRGRFIFDMAASLGGQSRIALWAPPGPLPDGVLSALSPEDGTWLQHLQARGGIAHLLRTAPPAGVIAAAGLLWRLGKTYRREQPVLAHVNWLQNALPLMGTSTPALVTVLGSDYALLGLPGMKSLLRRVFRRRPTILAPNAPWMAAELEHAFGEVARIRPVPFGVEKSWFEVRRRLPLPRRWLVVTRLTRAKLGPLLDWGEELFHGEDELHLIGPMQEDIVLPGWVHYHGPSHPKALRGHWFPEAAGLVTLSRHDEGRPQVMLEAMAAGLPVIASPIAAHRDFVRNGETGFLADSPAELAEAMRLLAGAEKNRVIGERARHWVRSQVGTWEDTAARYVALYEELLAAARRINFTN